MELRRREPSRFDRAELHESLERRKRDLGFVIAHREEWRSAYPDHWIATYDEKFLGADEDFEALRTRVEAMGIRFKETHLEFLARERLDLVLRI